MTPIQGCTYNALDGRIRTVFEVPTMAYANAQTDVGIDVLLGVFDPALHYVDVSGTPIKADRLPLGASWDTQQIIADGIDTATLTVLNFMFIRIILDGVPMTQASDGIVEFTALDPGDYLLVLDEVAFLREEWIINAQ